jgi:thiamine pyrophosphate-dependent acetolactate synthase large subunit-like protein
MGMSATTYTTSKAPQLTGGQAVVEALLRCGVTCGFGIPSIHNIGIYEALRQQPSFHHWIVRHEQAAGFAADGFFRRSGKLAVVFASTGPGNLFTLVPLLESFQTNTPVIVVGANVATPLLDKACGALHETPQQLEIVKPLTRFAARVASPEMIPEAIAAAAEAGGPAFVEIPQDLFYVPLAATDSKGLPTPSMKSGPTPSKEEIANVAATIELSRKPAVLVGSGVAEETAAPVRQLAEALQAPMMTTTSGKGLIADDHPLAMGCISRLGIVQELLQESDLLISFGARLTEFDTGRFALKLPARHIQVDRHLRQAGSLFPISAGLVGDVGAIAKALAAGIKPRKPWWDVAKARAEERERLEALNQDGYAALTLLRGALDRNDVVANDQSILNYWASAFFPVLEPRTFLYPTGSGTLGYGLPAAIGAACAARKYGKPGRVICIAGDGGFQYTAHELATLAQYDLPVKILLVNDNSYGIIGFLQRSAFGQTHEVALKNPDFCRLAESFGIRAQQVSDLEGLRRQLHNWLESPGPALLEWRTELKSPWEAGGIRRPANLPQPPNSAEERR